jgi:hypothetical protein
MAVYQRLLAELDANGQQLSAQISEIDLTDPEDARVLMPEQGADILAHFGEDHFLERYQRYKAHIAEWRQQYPSWRRWICAMTSRWCCRWLPQPTRRRPRTASKRQPARSRTSPQQRPKPDKPASAEKKAAGKPVLTAHAATNQGSGWEESGDGLLGSQGRSHHRQAVVHGAQSEACEGRRQGEREDLREGENSRSRPL